MAKDSLWRDEYWLLLMQLYLRKPAGVKAMYSKPLVDLSIELHIPPQVLHEKMFRLRRIDTPRMERLWKTYGNSPQKLVKGVSMLRRMNGFSNAEEFYDGVEVNESFEKYFRPIDGRPELKPVMLVIILNLYFRLTPITMVEDTPEIRHLAKIMKIKPSVVVEVMDIFRVLDPYMKDEEPITSNLLDHCRQVWQRFGNDNPEKLSALSALLMEYF
ncbi:MAG: hypothetical protein SOZ80_05345 [Prevotella sp.]|uniref:hypothetical protein n=1 Tax=Prevotella sp. TaxID=59823 RepID=UPI002A34BAFB|nr:hypothetical protein [Prevotella sp.]MDD7318464.1 hypothetical protein [Prevotellaceae bacterium]MDY4020185.1 hypothetical protein [Prevotella sp.]